MPNTMTDVYRAFFSELEKVSSDWKDTARNAIIGTALGGYSGSRVDKERHGTRNAVIGAALGGALGAGAGRGVTNLHTRLSAAPGWLRAGEHVQRYQPFYEGAAAAKGGLKAGATIGAATWAGKKLGLVGNNDRPPEKVAEIMPSDDGASIKKVPGSAIPRGPRVPAGGRVGTTTATPFSGNKAKIAGWGHAALGAGALVGGGVIAHRALKRPMYDEFISSRLKSPEVYGHAPEVSMVVGSPTFEAVKRLRQKRQYAQQSHFGESPYGAGPAAY